MSLRIAVTPATVKCEIAPFGATAAQMSHQIGNCWFATPWGKRRTGASAPIRNRCSVLANVDTQCRGTPPRRAPDDR